MQPGAEMLVCGRPGSLSDYRDRAQYHGEDVYMRRH